jgi:hypothetical protein
VERLDRGGRSLAAWRAALVDLARAGSSYRVAGLSPDDLAAVVGSPEAAVDRRIGAAIALRASGHPGAGERIRIAAERCASARVRAALQRVSEGAEEDEAVAEALAIEEGEAAARRRA